MYEYFGSGLSGDQKLEVANDSTRVHDRFGVYFSPYCIQPIKLMTQTTLLVVIVLLSLSYLGKKAIQSVMGKKKPGCEKCGISHDIDTH